MWRGVGAIVFGAILLLPASGSGAQQELAPSRQAALLARVLAYCRGVESQARANGKTVRVGVLYQSGNRASEKSRLQIAGAMQRVFGSTKIQGLKVEIVPLTYRGASALEQDIQSKGISVIYVTMGMDDAVDEVMAVSRKTSRLTVAARESYVAEGLAIGLIRRGSKPTILVNVAASKAESAAIHTGLLRVAEVVR